MGLTYSVTRTDLVGTQRKVTGTVTFDSSYATAGEAFAPSSVGLTYLTDLQVFPSLASATTGINPVWNRSLTAPKVMLVYGDNDAGADGAFAEVASTTDMSAVIVPFCAFGY